MKKCNANNIINLGGVAAGAMFVLTIISTTAAGEPPSRSTPSLKALKHLSQSVSTQYWSSHPEATPEQLQQRFLMTQQAAPMAGPHAGNSPFNDDDTGLPQNEESITACRSNANIVLGGTNDSRGFFLDPDSNSTGWHLSTDGGDSLAKEGLLPSVLLPGANVWRSSRGDPVDVADANDCTLWAASLNYDKADPYGQPNGIGVSTSPILKH